MKGVIVECMSQLVKEKKGEAAWEAILQDAGLAKNTLFLSTQDVEDATVMRVVDSACRVLGQSLADTADAFGTYWITRYAPKIYKIYFGRFQTAREFLLEMDQLHEKVTQNVPNARPPRFEYETPAPQTLIMTYRSGRGMIPFFIGLIKGVGRYFQEDLQVVHLGENRVKVRFPNASP
jgi:methyl-accepting chemotaxis protein